MVAGSSPDGRRALLLIDFQRDFLADDGRMPVARNHVVPVLAAARAAIDRARADGDLIIGIGNEFLPRDRLGNLLRHHAAVAGTAGTAWDERAGVPGSGWHYLAKWKGSAFCNPELGDLLAREDVRQVRLCGLYARACVTATARAALARGLQVTILRDAVACRSDASRAAALRRLNHRGVRLDDAIPA